MAVPVLQLTVEDLWRASAEINPDELLTRRAGATARPEGCFRPVPDAAATGGLVLFEDWRRGVRCLFPRTGLHQAQSALLTALGTRALLTPEPTVALLASASAASWHLAALARHVPGICHVALCHAGGETGIDSRVGDLLDQAGIALSVEESARRAVAGATLVIAAGPAHKQLSHAALAQGALVVNAAGEDLPDELVDHVDQVYVDDLGLLDRNGHRHFVRLHRAARPARRVAVVPEPEGWHRPAAWSCGHRVEADLGQVLTGQHRGRARRDDVLLCELFGTRVLNVALAGLVVRVALSRGLGVLLPDTSEVEGSAP